MGTVLIPFIVNDLEDRRLPWYRGYAFRFSYLRSITECAADNRSANEALRRFA